MIIQLQYQVSKEILLHVPCTSPSRIHNVLRLPGCQTPLRSKAHFYSPPRHVKSDLVSLAVLARANNATDTRDGPQPQGDRLASGSGSRNETREPQD